MVGTNSCMRTIIFCLLTSVLLFSYSPAYSCEGHDSEDEGDNVTADNEKGKKGHKKGKGKKHKNSDQDDNDSENEEPQSVIRGDEKSGAVRNPVLELD